ncbi:MAG: hypothetical protein IJX76_00260 [Clostridia bacterium]|nr:hypothetical protein [Clostridia bacterium]
MEALKSYLLTAMLASLAASLLIRISDPRYRTYVRYVAGLALLLLLTIPLTSLAGDLADELSETDVTEEEQEQSAREEVIGEIGRTMSRQIGDIVAQRFALSREAITVKLTLDLSDLSAISIYRVDLTVRVMCDAQEIEHYLSESLDCPVTVTVAEGDAQ